MPFAGHAAKFDEPDDNSHNSEDGLSALEASMRWNAFSSTISTPAFFLSRISPEVSAIEIDNDLHALGQSCSMMLSTPGPACYLEPGQMKLHRISLAMLRAQYCL